MLAIGFATLPAGCSGGDDLSGQAPLATSSWAPPTSASLPTPDEDGQYVYRNLTLEQAREILPFELVEPRQLPPGIEFVGIHVKEQAEELPDLGEDPTAIFVFRTGNPPVGPFFLAASTARSRLDDSSGDVSRLTVDGVEVSWQEQELGTGAPIVTYLWTVDRVTYVLNAQTSLDVTQEALQAMVGAMIAA